MKGDTYYKVAVSAEQKMYLNAETRSAAEKKRLYIEYLSLLRKAAYLGHTDAQFDLGQQYESISFLGINNPMYNPQKCVYWYIKACEKNHGIACNNLASFYEKGEGCDKSLVKAVALYERSAAAGYKVGKNNYKLIKVEIAEGGKYFDEYNRE